ncbi:13419_t:CDS:2, partial [Acaulospora morrowiae]
DCEYVDELGNTLLDNTPISKSVVFFKRSVVLWEAPNMGDNAPAITQLDLRFNFALDDNLPASFKAAYHSGGYKNGGIVYKLIAEIHTQGIAASTNVQAEVLINRWSLPSEKLENPIRMIRSNHNRTDENSLNSPIDKIKHEALLHQLSYDMNTSIRIPIRLILPTSRLSIKEITVQIKEYQKLKPGLDFSEHVTTREILRKRFKGDKLAPLIKDPKNLSTEYLFNVDADIPSLEENLVTPKIENAFNISHRIKNSVDQGIIELGRLKGEIYPLNHVRNNIN